MNVSRPTPDFAMDIAEKLPFLRRYARALTGNQKTGDNYAAATLEALLADKSLFDTSLSTKTALFRVLHQIWESSGSPVGETRDPGSIEGRAQWRLSGLTENTREALLLHSIEGFRAEDIASIIDSTVEEAADLLAIARSEMSDAIHGRIMIIEDEAIIAMDIRAIVEEMGHTVTNIARTRDEAITLARKEPPDMILADIQLADKSSGIDAVNQILSELGDLPIVFITAFPERLLTGERPEPAFLITKPYTETQVESAVSQAMFFAGTDTLRA
ncbi:MULTISPECIES: response regulator [unclassified Yoonia]|uniref:response regulator n=1 Tax=unclassified Yoonia TaxID=2629118 RepID=UPI002AFF776A|nr:MULTISPECIES: response regulator [unclassified Yoonia]